LVSVITVCYNERPRIADTLSSIVEQTYRPLELIVIDGGSSDGTLDIIQRYKENITVLISGKDQGIYDAMNKGIELARGEFILFMNGGDKFYSSDVLSNIFSNDIREDIIYGDVAAVFESGSVRVSRSPVKLGIMFFTHYNISHQATIYRAALLKNRGGFSLDYKILSDYEFLVSSVIVDRCSTRYVRQIISYFYKDGISSRDDMRLIRQRERVAIQKMLLPSIVSKYSAARFWITNNFATRTPGWLRGAGNRLFNLLHRPRHF